MLTLAEFWASIEDAWSGVPDDGARACLLIATTGADRLAAAEAVTEHLDAMETRLLVTLNGYDAATLAAWDAHCERALYTIDREDVHEALDGSDDGFLYCRGFVVACGQKYFEAVDRDPATYGVMDIDDEGFCYIGARVYRERFGEWTNKTGISRETGSNPKGWD